MNLMHMINQEAKEPASTSSVEDADNSQILNAADAGGHNKPLDESPETTPLQSEVVEGVVSEDVASKTTTPNNGEVVEGENHENNEAVPLEQDAVIKLAEDAHVELFHTPGSQSEAFVTIPGCMKMGSIPLGSEKFIEWINHQYYNEIGFLPEPKELGAAIRILKGRALYDSPEHPVAVRVAKRDGHIYIDLGDDTGQAVDVDATGWRVGIPPVKFERSSSMQSMPVPVKGGSVDEWRKTINVSDADWPLFAPTVLAMFMPGIPMPILHVQGEQGSAKTSACEQIRAIVDPNIAALRNLPHEQRDLASYAKNAWVVAFDNISSLPKWMADALCMMCTGGGFSKRQNFTDTDEIVLSIQRPVMLNGIPDLSSRSDLLDRMVTISLPVIPASNRRSSTAVDADFEELHPRVFGALLDALSCALRRLPDTHVDNLPRMADFALFGVAAEAGLGLAEGSFLKAYRANLSVADEVALESTPVAEPLLEWIEKKKHWTGTSRDMLTKLEQLGDKPVNRRQSTHWPDTPRKLIETLKRIAPNLRTRGLLVSFGDRGHNGVRIEMEWTGGSVSSELSQAQAS